MDQELASIPKGNSGDCPCSAGTFMCLTYPFEILSALAVTSQQTTYIPTQRAQPYLPQCYFTFSNHCDALKAQRHSEHKLGHTYPISYRV